MTNYIADIKEPGKHTKPFLVQEDTFLSPRIVPYNGWDSYKNVKSGQYNRQLCWTCSNFIGYPQEPGLYNLNINYGHLQPILNDERLDNRYIEYQKRRLSNYEGVQQNGMYRNYLDSNNCNFKLYPKKYVSGNWPDQQLLYTNTPYYQN